MFLVALLCANAVLGVKFTSEKTGYVNDWDRVMNYHAGRGKIITGIADSVHDNGKEDRRFKFYYTDGAKHGISCEPGSWTSYRNGWDGTLDFKCPSHQALNAVYSFHDNGKEDRLFRFKCCDIRSHGKFYIHSVHRTNLVSDWDGRLDSKCNPNSVLVGLFSYHDNGKEDRRWHLYCGIIQEKAAPIVTVSSPSKTGWINSWDRSFSWTAPSDRLIRNRHGICLDAPNRGSSKRVLMWSCSDSNSNQAWEYNKATGQIKLMGTNYCLDAPDTGKTAGGKVHTWGCNTSNINQHWEYDASTGLIKQQHGGLCLDAPSRSSKNGRLLMWPCNKYNYNQLWDIGTGGVKAIVGLESVHDNGKEDRLWKTYYASTPGVRCNPGGWTDYQNLWDGVLDYRCPRNQILAGFSSYHDNGKEDRRYRFRCCDVGPSGFHVSETRDIGRLNEWDAHLNFVCARNEVLVGLKGWHDNGKEDRRFHGLCGTLTQNPPDYDDCSEVNVVDVEVGKIEAGDRKTKSVAKYTGSFKACGNSITPGMSTMNIETSTSVSKTESLELGKSLEQSFKFSSTIETSFKFSKSVTAEVSKGVASASATVGMEFGLSASFTTENGKTVSSSETKTTETGKVDVNVVSISNTFDPEPYQWREARASYIVQDVIVPLRMKAQCKRKDGKTKTLWIESKLTAAAYSQVEVDFVDRTNECPQSYYKKCECVDQLKSQFITRDGCQTHPFFEGHPGCYVFKGNNCGNGQGLGTAEPVSFVNVCTDAESCPQAKLYIDYPLDEYVWEWSYKPCGGDQYYPGDPGYTGPPVNDMVLPRNKKHCREGNHGTLGSYAYDSKVQAILACDAKNQQRPGTCSGVYDPSCDNRGKFYLCDNDPYKTSSSSCIYEMQDQYDDGKWTLVFRQTMPYKWPKGAWSMNANNPSADNFSILNTLEQYKRDGKFQFKMVWPKDTAANSPTYIWTQTSNPTKGRVSGYKGIEAPYTGRFWGGLEKGSSYSLMDGSVNHGNWFYALGSYQHWNGAYPAYAKTNSDYAHQQTQVELYVWEVSGRRRVETDLPKAPESLEEVTMTEAELIEEFGDDLVDEEEEWELDVTEDVEEVEGMSDEDDDDDDVEDMPEMEDSASSEELEAPASAEE